MGTPWVVVASLRVAACNELLRGGLRLENLIALGQGDPGLFAAGPDMPSWSQP
jgi:hypothetical protein